MTRFVIFILCIISNSFEFIECDTKFTKDDFRLIKYLSYYLNSVDFVFISDGLDYDLIKKAIDFSREFFICSVLNTQTLNTILSNNVTQLNFFQRKTAVISKEDLNLPELLEKILFPRLVIWTIFGSTNYKEIHYIPTGTDVLFINWTGDVVTVEQVYHFKRGFEKVIKTIWNNSSISLLKLKTPFVSDYKKNNFHNVTMDMHILLGKNFCENLHGKDMIKKVECLHQDLLELIGARLNFSLNYIECIDKENPYTYPNGTESELFTMLRRRKVDFSAASHLIQQNRIGSFDFIWPTFVLKSMMYIKPARLTGHWTSYLKPLDNSIWLAILYFLLLAAVFVEIFDKLLSKKFSIKISFILNLINSILTSLQIFCSQGLSDMPMSNSIKTLYLVQFSAFIIFYQAYSGLLISSLTVVVPYFPFIDLKGFLENKQYKMMTIERGFQNFFFKKVIGEGKRTDFMLIDDLPKNSQEAVDLLCMKDHLVFSEFKEEMLAIESFNCNIIEIPYSIVRIYMTIVSPKNSPYTEFVNRERIYLETAGIMSRMRAHLSSQTDFKERKSFEEYITVSMKEVFPVYILLGFGIIVSVVALFFEIVINCHCRCRSVGV